jgi:chemotaxis protein CheD
MAEQAASASPADVLVTIGLGSCIGLALLDPRTQIAGLVHIVLPDSSGARGDGAPARFADTAVPALVQQLTRLGASLHRLEAVLAGGAQMFSFGADAGSGLDIGRRNEAAVLAALKTARIPVRAAATGGKKGRTLRVHVATRRVTVREAGGTEVELFAPAGEVRREA